MSLDCYQPMIILIIVVIVMSSSSSDGVVSKSSGTAYILIHYSIEKTETSQTLFKIKLSLDAPS